MTTTRDNEETSLRMMIDKAYELMDKRTEECVQKYGNADAAKSDLYVFGFRASYLYRWERNAWRARSDAATVWSKDVESLIALNNKVRVLVCGLRSRGRPGGSHAEGSLTRTTWPGAITLVIRDNIFKHLKEGTSSKMGDGGSMSESEDVEMTGEDRR